MATTILGKVSVTPKGTWSSATAYDKLDIVYNNGSSYISLQDVPTGVAISNASYWLCIAEKGDKGDKGDTGATGATGATGNGIQDVYLTATVGNVDTYTILYTDGTTDEFTVTNGNVTSVNGRTGAVTGLAEIDGYYENLSSGSSDQLISTIYAEDSVPYVFRTSGGSADIGDREFDEIVGGTIAWNQLLTNSVSSSITSNGVTVTYSNGVYSWSGVASADATFSLTTRDAMYKDHIYLKTYVFGSQSTYYATGAGAGLNRSYMKSVGKASADSGFGGLGVVVLNGTDMTGVSFTLNLFDLTQMFGSTIAEYVLTLETNNMGDGLAWFTKLFPKPYYAYNTGTLISVNASAHETTGFNQFMGNDTTVSQYVGHYYVNGSGSNYSRVSNASYNCFRVEVIPNTAYCMSRQNGNLSTRSQKRFLDDNGTFISGNETGYGETMGVFTTPSNCKYVEFAMSVNDGADILCLNISWSGYRDGEFEEYVKHTYPLDSSLTLRGISKLDADNSLYYDGDTYASDGTVTRNCVYTEITSFDGVWGATDVGYAVYKSIDDYNHTTNNPSRKPQVMSNRFVYDSNGYASMPLYGVGGGSGASKTMTFILPSTVTSLAGANTWLSNNPTYIVYFSTTPTTETADSFVSPQIVDDFGTERYVVTEQNGVAVPVGHNTKYAQNLRDKIQHLPDLASSDGNYIITQNGTQMSLTPYTLPPIPSASGEDGTYVLKATISGGTVAYTWVAE